MEAVDLNGLELAASFDGCFTGRRVLVTGHTGFKGAWLTEWLLALGADVTGFSNAVPTRPSLYEDLALGSRMRSLRGDVRDADALRAAFHQASPELVLHLAAQPLVRASYADPAATFATNVMGTANVLQVAADTDSVRAVVNVTSDKCYENLEQAMAYREDDAMGGHDPYSASKGCAELVAASYRRSVFQPRGIHLASARAGNVIGGGDWALDRLLPDCMRAFAAGTPVKVRNPASTRPWQHVLEPLSGYLRIAQLLLSERGAEFARGWNLGPLATGAVSVGDVVNRACSAWGSNAAVEVIPPEDGLHESTLLDRKSVV